MNARQVTIMVVTGMTLLVGLAANAKEERFQEKMPTANEVKITDLKKSKKPGYECAPVKQGPKGNYTTVANSKPKFFTDVPDTTDAVNGLMENGKRVVRCTLKGWDSSKHKMANADVGDEGEQ